jgi:beta-lactamase regulating signal transducer with metallopeptidase domain
MSGAVDLAVRAIVVLSLTWIVVALLRRQSASLRALVWAVAFGGLLALPALSRIAPAWHVGIWPSPARVEVVAAEPESALPLATDEASAASPDVPASRDLSRSPTWRVSPASPTPPAQPIDWTRAALAVWALIAGVLLARLVASHARMSHVLAEAGPASHEWTALVDARRTDRRIRRSVRVRVSDAVNIPAIAGVFRPTLLLPSDSEEWQADMRDSVVLHELAHVARWDGLAQLAGQLGCAIYWFIPLAWHGARRAAALRERASDDEVLRAGVPASRYAQRLLDLVRGPAAVDLQTATIAMARPSRMRERVVAILDPVARREGVTMRTTVAAVILSTGAIAVIAAAAPEPSETLILNPSAVATAEAAPLPTPSPAPSSPVASVTSAPARHPVTDIRSTAPDAQTSARPCDGDLQQHHQMSGEKNGRRTLTLKLSGGGCTVDLKADGRLTFNDDFTDIAALESGGFFRLDVTEQGVRRELNVESRNGSLARTWRVNGREAPYDATAQAWFAAFLIDLDRRTAIGIDVRLPHLLRAGGVKAVLDETGLMASDYARGLYYTRLLKTAQLSTADVTRVLQQAAKLTKSDHYAHELIRAVAPRGLSDRAQRAAVTDVIDGMESDHYRAESIKMLVASGRPGAEELDLLVRMLPRMKSDHYKSEVMTQVLKGATLTPAQQALLVKSAVSIQSDHYAAEFLKTLAAAGAMAPDVRQAYFQAVRGIQGDHYASEVLRQLIRTQRPSPADVEAILQLTPALESDHYRTEVFAALLGLSDLSERDLLGIVSAARSMGDHYEAETLRKVVRHRAATDRVRDAAVSAAADLSRHYRDEVSRAAGRSI